MLWYKAWRETRLRFLIGLGLLVLVAVGTVAGYPAARELAPLAEYLATHGTLGERIRESLELQASYRGYIWLRWYTDNLAQLGTLFAIILGSGNLLSHSSGRGALFTLSLPASRTRLLFTRAAIGLAEWLALVVISSLAIVSISPAFGERYALLDAFVHSFSMFAVGSIYFSLALLLSSVINDVWRPLLIAFAVAVVLAACEYVLWDALPFGLVRSMSAETYFRHGELPWPGIAASASLSAGMLYMAGRLFARRDF